MSQTTYAINMTTGIEGDLADPNADAYKVSRVAGADLPAARLMVRDSAVDPAKGVKLPDAAFTEPTIIGVLMRDPSKVPTSAGLNFTAGDSLPVLRKGRIFVSPQDAVVANADVYSVHTGGEEGRFRSDAAGGNAAIVPGARYITGTSAADEICVMEINLPAT